MARVLCTSLAAATPAVTHYGHTGDYGATCIIYIEGVVEEATITLSHLELTSRIDAGVTLPDELPDLDTLGIADARVSTAALSWVQSAYTLTFGGLLLLDARARGTFSANGRQATA